MLDKDDPIEKMERVEAQSLLKDPTRSLLGSISPGESSEVNEIKELLSLVDTIEETKKYKK